jgi:hypothetical protein
MSFLLDRNAMDTLRLREGIVQPIFLRITRVTIELDKIRVRDYSKQIALDSNTTVILT